MYKDELLFCSLDLLFGDVPFAVIVVVSLSSLLRKPTKLYVVLGT